MPTKPSKPNWDKVFRPTLNRKPKIKYKPIGTLFDPDRYVPKSPPATWRIRPKKKITPSPSFSHPVKIALYPVRTKREVRLIDKNPWGDKDRDKVPNIFDCRPLDKNQQGWSKKRVRFGEDRRTKTVMMPPERFLKATYNQYTNLGRTNAENYEGYLKEQIQENLVKELKAKLRNPKIKMDVPFIKYDMIGNPQDAEGRHRAMAAKELGISFIPVTIAIEKSKSREEGIPYSGGMKEMRDALMGGSSLEKRAFIQKLKTIGISLEEAKLMLHITSEAQKKYRNQSLADPEFINSINESIAKKEAALRGVTPEMVKTMEGTNFIKENFGGIINIEEDKNDLKKPSLFSDKGGTLGRPKKPIQFGKTSEKRLQTMLEKAKFKELTSLRVPKVVAEQYSKSPLTVREAVIEIREKQGIGEAGFRRKIPEVDKDAILTSETIATGLPKIETQKPRQYKILPGESIREGDLEPMQGAGIPWTEEELKEKQEKRFIEQMKESLGNIGIKPRSGKRKRTGSLFYDKRATLGRKMTDDEIKKAHEEERLQLNEYTRKNVLSKIKDVTDTPKKIQTIIPDEFKLEIAEDVKEQVKIEDEKLIQGRVKKDTLKETAEIMARRWTERELQKAFEDFHPPQRETEVISKADTTLALTPESPEVKREPKLSKEERFEDVGGGAIVEKIDLNPATENKTPEEKITSEEKVSDKSDE